MLAYIGSREGARSFACDSELVSPVSADSISAMRGERFVLEAFGSRLLRQTRLFPLAISSIVRPLSTEVMFSATTSSSVANWSRCLIISH